MKKKYISSWIVAFVMLVSLPAVADAQLYKQYYINVDWQLNMPLSNSYADKTSGWGAHAEGGFLLTRKLSVGAFINFHTNNKYIPRQTIEIDNSSTVTSDQQHSIFTIPFGPKVRYTFTRDGLFEPYIAAGLGANYSEVSSYMNIMKLYEREWGFYASPEVGITMFLTREKQIGIHLAAYYSYATNKTDILSYTVDGLNNFGVRLGLAF